MKKAKKPMSVQVDRMEGAGFDISLSFHFPESDPPDVKFWKAVGLFLKRVLSPDEAREFMRQLEEQKQKALGKSAE